MLLNTIASSKVQYKSRKNVLENINMGTTNEIVRDYTKSFCSRLNLTTSNFAL